MFPLGRHTAGPFHVSSVCKPSVATTFHGCWVPCPALPSVLVGAPITLASPWRRDQRKAPDVGRRLLGKKPGRRSGSKQENISPPYPGRRSPVLRLRWVVTVTESREQHRNFLSSPARSISKLQIAPGKSTGKKQGKSRHLRPGSSQGVSCEAPWFRQRNNFQVGYSKAKAGWTVSLFH